MSDTEANYDLFVSYAEADRAWVEGYLLDALTTAGVRCHSEAAFTLGAPRILEFERAIQQSRRTLLVLSPAYLAEHFDQFADVLAQSYGLETATWPVIPLILQPIELPPRLAMLTALDAADPADWPAVIERLCEALQRPVPGPAPKPACPYPGMVPFSETDSDRFYGRDEEVRELLERLRLHPFVTVIGPSGSGKSSLVFAGLVPALRQSGLFGPDEWLVRALRPGEAPLDALTDALDGDPTDPARAVTELLATGPDVRRLLLVVDQFEELFTLARLDVEPFQQALMQLAETPDCYVALTVRADFYPDLMAAPLWREIKTYRAEVLPLDEDGLRQAIVRPAEDVGVFVETALVERLVADAAKEPGILPLIQETLVLLWERLERRFLPLSAYEALGGTGRTGLQMAMARRADAALAGLTPEQQAMARRIFLRLVQFGEGRADTCRQQPIAALRSAGDDADRFDRTLEHLTHNRLLTLSGEEGGDDRKVDIAHEALIAGWPTLRGWLAERREAEQTRRRLEAKAAEWVRLGRGSGGLLDEVVLLEAERWLASPEAEELGASEALTALATKSQEAIEAAEREREAARQWEFEQAQALAAEAEARRLAEEQRAQEAEAREREQAKAAGRLRRLAVGLALALVLALMATFFAVWQSRVATARQLTAQAQTTLVQERFHMATLLALEANRLDKKEGVDVLHQIPYHAPHRDALALEGHKDWVNSVAWHPDGRRLASGSSDRRIIIWDTETGEAVTTLKGHTGTVFSVAWHPDGRRLASGSSDGRIIIWDTETGETVTTLEGYTGPVNNLAWHPDGRTLAIGSYYRRVVIWNTETGETILIEHGASVNSVAWHPDGRRLAYGVGDSVGEDDRILIWDKETGEIVTILEGHTGPVNSVAWHPDGRTLASGSDDQRIIVWDVEKGEAVTTLAGHSDRVTSVAWHPDGRILASGAGAPLSRDDRVIIWDTEIGEAVTTLWDHTGGATTVAWHPDGRTLASATNDDRRIIIWDTEIEDAVTTLKGHTDSVNSVAWHPDGRTLASGSDDRRIIIWDMEMGEPVITLEGHTARVNSVAWHPDGRLLASGASGSSDRRIIIWDTETGETVTTLQGHRGAVTSVAWRPDGRRLASGSSDRRIIIWDTETGETVTTLQGHRGAVTSVAWHPDGRILASGGGDPTSYADSFWEESRGVIVWDTETGQAITTLQGHPGGVTSVVWHPAGRMLASSGRDEWLSDNYRIIIWDMETGKPTATLRHRADSVNSLTWHPDGRILASGTGRRFSKDSAITIWDTEAGEAVITLKGHTDSVRTVAWHPDGRTLASGSLDRTIHVRPEIYTQPPCNWVVYNLSVSQWLRHRGWAIYQPTCGNLPSPAVPMLLTLQGRLLLIGVPVLLLGLVGLMPWGGFRLVRRMIRKRVRRGNDDIAQPRVLPP